MYRKRLGQVRYQKINYLNGDADTMNLNPSGFLSALPSTFPIHLTTTGVN